MNLTFHIWRQKNHYQAGFFKKYHVSDLSKDMSFLEALDVLNEQIIKKNDPNDEPIAFDYDCREGICGMCSLVINGTAHGKQKKDKKAVTTCQLHLRSFKNEDEIWIEPWRVKAFPIIKDLIVDRSALDRIIQSGGYVSVNTGSCPDANSTPVAKDVANEAFDSATCIGCGACAAACKNSSAALFLSAKINHLSLLPQGKVEAQDRVLNMVDAHDKEGFGSCSNTKACEAVCPVGISSANIVKLNRQYLKAAALKK